MESCGMRHHTLVHEVDNSFIERAKTKKQEHGTAKSPPPRFPPPTNEKNVGFASSFLWKERGKADSYGFCNTTLMDEELAVELGLEGREIDIELQGINSHRVVSSKHISKCQIA